MSAQKMADALAELGVPVERSVLAGLENGRRKIVTVAEVIAFARVLNVAPLALIYPVEETDLVEVAPGVAAEIYSAARWFTGDAPFPDSPEGAGELEAWIWGDISALARVRHHDRTMQIMLNVMAGSQKLAALTAEAALAAEGRLPEGLRLNTRVIMDECAEVVRSYRQKMRDEGAEPPPLPAEFAYLDDSASQAPASASVGALDIGLIKRIEELGRKLVEMAQELEVGNDGRRRAAS